MITINPQKNPKAIMVWIHGLGADENDFVPFINNLELDITSVSPPELNLFSGKMLYINDIEQVTRNAEQLDLFKINFDF